MSEQENPKPNHPPLEDQQNLVGFFELLLKVDKRVNPHLYKMKTRQND
jgi:hypothetical protein